MYLLEFLFILFGSFSVYLSFLANKISDTTDSLDKKDTPLDFSIFWPRRRSLRGKFYLPDNYPDKEILKLSRRYDRLLGIFYVVFVVLVAIMVIAVILK